MTLQQTCFAGFALLLVLGCQTGPRTYHVKGTVTYKGVPVPDGQIIFDPDMPKNDGPQGFAVIKDGAYDTSLKPNGRPVGSMAYVVKIRGFDGKPADELPMGQPLFAEYRKEVDLPTKNSVQDFNVDLARE